MTNNIDTILKRLGVPAKFGPQVQAADFFATYPDGVFASFGSGSAVAGWDTFRVQFAGVGSRETARRFESMLFRAFRVEGFLRTSIDGLLTLSFRCRVRPAIAGVFGRGNSGPVVIDPTWLYFTMPEGGTVTLTKKGSPPAATLEYSLDNGGTWTEWTESGGVRSLTLTAGQTMHVRSASETVNNLSLNTSSYYQFSLNGTCLSGGNILSLKCKTPSSTTNCGGFANLFKGCTSLITPADMSTVTEIGGNGCYHMYEGCTSLINPADIRNVGTVGSSSCYSMYQGCTSLGFAADMPLLTTTTTSSLRSMYQDCTSITSAADISSLTLIGGSACYSMYSGCTSLESVDMSNVNTISSSGCFAMYYGCTSLKKVIIGNPDISATNCILNWLGSVSATGDFYCSPLLTIPTGASGIPNGWTRHDI